MKLQRAFNRKIIPFGNLNCLKYMYIGTGTPLGFLYRVSSFNINRKERNSGTF